MIHSWSTDPARLQAYRLHLTNAAKIRQRWLILGGGLAYAMASLWMSFRIGLPPQFAIALLQLAAVTLLLFGFTFARTPGPLLEFNPALMCIAVGAHILLGAAEAPQESALRTALLFATLMVFAVAAAPTLRSTVAALAAIMLITTAGAVFFASGPGTAITAVEAAGFALPAFVAALLVALTLEHERRASFEMRAELERRATSDELSGVSNRAHITLLAQNEFARARRYREPYSCLMLEIDGYDSLAKSAPRAADVIVQIFSGYCVVVMRHCDSFGRLSPARFLALLPETQGVGAHTLAQRMCRDLGSLEVMHESNPLHFTVSIGATELDVTDRWASDMLRRAEQGLEDAIERGRSMAVFATAHQPVFDTGLEESDTLPLRAQEK